MVFEIGFRVEEEFESLREQGITVKERTCSVGDSLGVADLGIEGPSDVNRRGHHKGQDWK